MKKNGKLCRKVALSCAFLASLSQAANYYWDGDTVTVDGASNGGSGAWTVGVGGWEDGASAVNWANGHTAVLGGSGTFTNTLGGAITAAGITVSGANYVITGAYALAAGALNIASGASIELANGAASPSWTVLAGDGTLTVNNPNNMNLTTVFNSANALAFNGTLALRGAGWITIGGASLSQAAGTAFALDTGTSSSSKKDLVITDAFNGKTLNLTSLTGYGGLRVDWGGTGLRTILVDQAVSTTFNGTIAAHDSTSDRSIDFKKAGSGSLTLAGVLSDGPQAPLSVLVTNGTLVMTANNTFRGPIVVRTNAVLKMQNGSAGTDFTGGNSAMTGNYTVDAGGVLQGFRNGTAAFGQGKIILNGGKLAQEQGNWTWANDIVLGSGFTSTLESQSSNTGTRFLKIQGVVSGDGNLTFSDTTGGMGADTGFIFTGSNTLSGTVTIPANRKVRVGGVPGNDSNTAAGPAGTLGTAAIVNNGTLTFSRSDAHTFANTISGSGNVRVGSTGIAGSGTQVAALTGVNTYSGGTGVNTGTLLVNGSHVGGTLYDVGANATLGGTGTVSVAGGGSVNLLNLSTLAAGPATGEGGAFTLNTLMLAAGARIAVDATNDLVVVNGNLTLNDNAVTLANESAFNRQLLYPILTCSGTLTGSLAATIDGTRWGVTRIGDTFYLQYRPLGTLIRVQ